MGVPALAAAAWATPLASQSREAPPGALDLVVALTTRFAGDDTDFGAGIIVGRRGDTLLVATARHVVVRRNTGAVEIGVRFRDSTTATGTVRHAGSPSLDLAVVGVVLRGDSVPPMPVLDRLGSARRLRFGDPVRAVGCPSNICWSVPGEPDPVTGFDATGLAFQSTFVRTGSSGGALFNEWWEVVGLVVADEPPRGLALPIEVVTGALGLWNDTAQLHRPAIPRAGYHVTVGIALFASTPSPFERVPAGRLTWQVRERQGLSWHAGWVRLARENVTVDALMAGISVTRRTRRLLGKYFAEVGFGGVEGRFDRGGYYVVDGPGNRYVPVWERARETSLGFGGGAGIEWIVRPGFIVEVLAGYWSFGHPAALSNPSGMRVGLDFRAPWFNDAAHGGR